MDIQPSAEQQQVINLFMQNYNLRVITPAGGAKTSTSLLCIQQLVRSNVNKKVLFLTYNERLKREIREKVEKYGLRNITDAHNFHAFACVAYKKKIYTDNLLKKELDKNTSFVFKGKYEILIVDEAQDINQIYYNLIQQTVKNCGIKQIMLIGDPRQSIFAFNGADQKILIDPEKYFTDFKFTLIENNDTYRNTKHMTNFLNKSFLQNGSVISRNTGSNEKIDYWLTDIYDCQDIIYQYIEKYGSDNIFILAFSIKPNKNQPLIKVIDNLKTKYKNQLNFYISSEDDTDEIEAVVQNKIACLTFHKSKGLERKCVMVFGFDEAYDKYFNKENEDRPNPLYVALTRAQEKLVILCSRTSRCYKTVNYQKVVSDLNILPENVSHFYVKRHFEPIKTVFQSCPFHKFPTISESITDAVKYLSGNIVNQLLSHIDKKEGQIQNKKYNHPCKKLVYFEKTDISEDLSSYYGSIITLLFAKSQNKFEIDQFIRQQIKQIEHEIDTIKMSETIRAIITELKKCLLSIYQKINQEEEALFRTAICLEAVSGFSHKFYQIIGNKQQEVSSFFDREYINKCISSLTSELLSLQLKEIEKSFSEVYPTFCPKCFNIVDVNLFGRIDLLLQNNKKEEIYEIKAKTELKETDMIQALLYSSILSSPNGKKPCILFNVQTGEKIKISGNEAFIKEFINLKYFTNRGSMTSSKKEDIDDSCSDQEEIRNKNLLADLED